MPFLHCEIALEPSRSVNLVIDVIVTLQNFGEPLICDSTTSKLPERFMNAVCSAKHTVSIQPRLFGNRTSFDPKLLKFAQSDEWIPLFQDHKFGFNNDMKDEISLLRKQILIRHSAYPYIWIMYLILGILCYFPWALWKTQENGLLSCATKDMDRLPPNPDTLQNHVKRLRQNIFNRNHKTLVSYLAYYWISELLALINIVFIFSLCHWILDYQLISFGLSYFKYLCGYENPADINPILYFWPPTTLCGQY